MGITTVRIETRTIIRLLVTITIFGFLVMTLFKISSIIVIFLVAFFLALALNPPVARLTKIMPHKSRIGASAIAYVIVLAVLGLLVYVAAPPVIQQTNSFVSGFPDYVKEVTERQNVFSGLIERYDLQDEIDKFVETTKNESGNIAKGVGSSFVSGVSSVLNGAITLLTILVLTFLMLIEGPAWMQRIWGLYSHKHRLERDQRLVSKMYKVVTNYVNGQVMVAAIGASSVFVVLFVLSRIFSEVPLGAILPLTGIAFISALIPMFGATIAAVIITIVLLFSSVPAAIAFVVFFIIYQQIENNVIQPVVQSRSVQLTALGVLSAAIIGIAVLGLIGAIIAIPVAGCIRVLLLDYLANKKDYLHDYNSSGKLIAATSTATGAKKKA